MSRPGGSSPRAAAAGLAAGLASLALYVATNHPLVSHHDAAEFQTLAATGGIAHAGYPLVVMLLELFGRLPLGTMAFRANLLSCVSGALAVGLAAYGGARLSGRAWAGLVAALTLALSFALWRESTLAGAHAFTLAIGAALFLLSVRFAAGPSGRGALALGALWGAGLVSHLTVLSLLPVLAAALWLAWRARRLRLRHGWAAAAGLLVGLLPLAYLVAQDRPDQPMNYIEYTLAPGAEPYFPEGKVPENRLQRAWWLLSARQLEARTHFHAFERPLPRLKFLALDLGLNEFPLWGAPLALLGAWRLRRRPGPEGLFLALWLAATLLLLLAGADFPSITAFVLPGLWALSQLMAAGIAGLTAPGVAAATALLLGTPFARLNWATPPPRWARTATLVHVWEQWPRLWSPLRADPGWERFGRGVMTALPARAVVLSCWSEGTVLRYFRYAEPLRTDVEIVFTCTHPKRVRAALASARRAGRAVFCTFDPAGLARLGDSAERAGGWSRGGLWRFNRKGGA